MEERGGGKKGGAKRSRRPFFFFFLTEEKRGSVTSTLLYYEGRGDRKKKMGSRRGRLSLVGIKEKIPDFYQKPEKGGEKRSSGEKKSSLRADGDSREEKGGEGGNVAGAGWRSQEKLAQESSRPLKKEGS